MCIYIYIYIYIYINKNFWIVKIVFLETNENIKHINKIGMQRRNKNPLNTSFWSLYDIHYSFRVQYCKNL